MSRTILWDVDLTFCWNSSILYPTYVEYYGREKPCQDPVDADEYAQNLFLERLIPKEKTIPLLFLSMSMK